MEFYGGIPEGDREDIYFLYAKGSGKVKIGKTVNMERRMKQLISMIPEEVELVVWLKGFPRGFEDGLHYYYADWGLHGEWFEEEVLNMFLGRIEEFKGDWVTNVFLYHWKNYYEDGEICEKVVKDMDYNEEMEE